MDFGSMLDDSFAYAKEGVWEKWKRWLILILSMIIFPLILGYIVRIYRGEKPAPEPGEWGTLFVDGLKLLIVQIIYMAPVILLLILAFIPLISTLAASGVFSPEFSSMSDSQSAQWMDRHPELVSELLLAGGIMVLLLIVAVILAIVLSLFSFLGVVRFARTHHISEAFNFGAIIAHIGRIGWINYIIALIAITVIGFIFSIILNFFSLIPVIGTIFGLCVMVILYVPFLLFSARFSALVYDTGEERPGPEQGTSAAGELKTTFSY
jgi:MFS family permease